MTRSRRLVWLLGAALQFAPGATVARAEHAARVDTAERTLTGRLVSIDEEQIVIEDAAGRQRVGLEEALCLALSEPIPTSAPNRSGRVGLVDGSEVPFERWSVVAGSEGRRRFECPGEGAPGLTIDVPLARVKWWRTPTDDPQRTPAWSEIAAPDASDALVILTPEGALRVVQGVIDRVAPGGVRFLLDGEAIEVPWRKVSGLFFFREPSPRHTGPVLLGEDGLRLSARSVVGDAGRLTLSTTWGGEAEIQSDKVIKIDYSFGKTQDATDLRVIRASWKPFFGAEQAFTAGELSPGLGGLPRGAPRRSHGPLSLLASDRRLPGVWEERSYPGGWVLRSRSTLELRLPAEASWLRGHVGIAPDSARTGAALVSIATDRGVLWSETVEGGDAPYTLRLPLDGAERLMLSVDYGENLDTGDVVHFAALRVLK